MREDRRPRFGDLEPARDLVERAGIEGVGRLVDADESAGRGNGGDMREVRPERRKAGLNVAERVGNRQLIRVAVLVVQ
jgi:hypothetical protein